MPLVKLDSFLTADGINERQWRGGGSWLMAQFGGQRLFFAEMHMCDHRKCSISSSANNQMDAASCDKR